MRHADVRAPGVPGEPWAPGGQLDRAAHEVAAQDEPLPPPTCLAALGEPAPLEFAIDGVVVKREVNAVVGDGDAGKSTVMYAGAGATAAGALAYGDRLVQPGPVMLAMGEDSADVARNRIEAIARGHGWDVAATLANVHVYDKGVDLDDLRWQLRLIEAAQDVKAVLACFDPIVDLCGDKVEENSNTDAKRVTRYLRTFARATGATPWLAMHVSKPGEGKTERKHPVRGASAWRNATRMCWWVEAAAGGIELDPIKANRLARSQTLYLKRTVTADPAHPLMWKVAHIALDTAGDVVQAEVLKVMAYVAACKQAPSSNEAADGNHGVPRDRARAALTTARNKGWLLSVDGPRNSQRWSITEAGSARLMLG